MSMKTTAILTAGALAATLMLASPLQADVLVMEGIADAQARDLPDNGLTQSQVEQRWGAPETRHPAVGQPPIVRWDYADYSVYFDRGRVLTSVMRYGSNRTDANS